MQCRYNTAPFFFQVGTNDDIVDFAEHVSYCAHKFQSAGDMYCIQVSKKLNEVAAIFSEVLLLYFACKPASTYSGISLFKLTGWQAKPQLNLILRLYSSGLSIMVCDSKFGESKVKDATDYWKIQALLDDETRWQSLVSLLSMGDSYSGVGNHTEFSLVCGHKNYISKTDDTCTDINMKNWWLQYVDALKFLCQPLATLINSVKRKIVFETEMSCASAHLSTIHDAFLQFCDGCLFLQR